MSEFRNGAITAADIELIERAGYRAHRAHDSDEGLALHTLALRLRSTSGLWPGFHCDVDESAGMAEIVDLHDFSKKVS